MPKEVAQRIAAWCETRTPPEFRDQVNLTSEVRGNKVTIVENSLMGDQWLAVPSAQLQFDPYTQMWALYWSGADERFHIYEALPTLDVTELLREIEADRHSLFFG